MNPNAGGAWSYLNVDEGSTLYLIASTADNGGAVIVDASGDTGTCAYALNSGTASGYSSEIFFGGYASAIAYELQARFRTNSSIGCYN